MATPEQLLKSWYLLALFFLFFYNDLWAQSKENKINRNTVYAEVASKAAVYSINFDHIFHQGEKVNWSYRVGFYIGKESFAVPLGINVITGKKNHHAEFGLTLEPYVDHDKTFLSGSNANLSDKYLYMIPAAGYRFQPPTGGFFFKVTISPLIFLDPPSNNFWKMDPKIFFYGSAAAGFSF